MVGEIRDEETAAIAVQSALTGHLVFTTVHANNVVDVLGRFLNMKVDLYNFVSALNCVLAQRLVRRVCDHCRREVKYNDAFLVESGLPADVVALSLAPDVDKLVKAGKVAGTWADGSAKGFVTNSVDLATWRALATRKGGEVVSGNF